MCVCDSWLVNRISQDSNDGYLSYLVYKLIILRGRALLFLVEAKSHVWSPEFISRKSCKHDISRYEAWILFTWLVNALQSEDELYCFWWKSKDI